MSTKSSARSILILSLLSLCSTTYGAGFAIYEHSARGMGLGGAVIGEAADASTVADNPAAMTDLEGFSFYGGLTAIVPTTDISIRETGRKYHMKRDAFAIPAVFATWQLSDKWWLGFGEYTEFGLGTRYHSNWDLAYSSYDTSLETFTINPTIAYKLTDDLSLALGMRIMYAAFEYHSRPLYNAPSAALSAMGVPPVLHDHFREQTFNVDGDDVGFGWNAAVRYRITDKWSWGFTYRSPTWIHIKGDIWTESRVPSNIVPGAQRNTKGDGKITLPQAFVTGVNYAPTKDWLFGAIVTWTQWSSYEALNINVNQPLPAFGGQTVMGGTKNYHDVFRFGIGGEWQFIDNFKWRMGFVYDMDPTAEGNADTIVPAADRFILSSGLGYTYDWLTVDLSYSFLYGTDETRTIHGAAHQALTADFSHSRAHMLALNIGAKF